MAHDVAQQPHAVGIAAAAVAQPRSGVLCHGLEAVCNGTKYYVVTVQHLDGRGGVGGAVE